MTSLASAYLARALSVRLQDYTVQCNFLKNGTLELVLTHVNSHETYAISGVAKMNPFSTLAVTGLAHLLLSEIETCQTSNLLNSGLRPSSIHRQAKRRAVGCALETGPAASIPLFTV